MVVTVLAVAVIAAPACKLILGVVALRGTPPEHRAEIIRALGGSGHVHLPISVSRPEAAHEGMPRLVDNACGEQTLRSLL